MSLKNLSTAAMVSVTSNWVKPGQERNLLLGSKKLAPLLPDIEEAHQNLLATQPGADAPSKELAAIQSQEAEADALHDRKLRGLYSVLSGLVDLADSPDDAQQHAALRDRLFPEGLMMTKAGYASEAGAVEMVEQRLTQKDRELAQRLMLQGTSIQQHIKLWVDAGKKLGELEQRRSTLKDAPGPTRADAARARNGWINVMNAVLQMSLLEKTLDDDGRELLFGLANRLQAQAETRRGAGTNASAGDGGTGLTQPNPGPAGGGSAPAKQS